MKSISTQELLSFTEAELLAWFARNHHYTETETEVAWNEQDFQFTVTETEVAQ